MLTTMIDTKISNAIIVLLKNYHNGKMFYVGQSKFGNTLISPAKDSKGFTTIEISVKGELIACIKPASIEVELHATANPTKYICNRLNTVLQTLRLKHITARLKDGIVSYTYTEYGEVRVMGENDLSLFFNVPYLE